MMKAIRIRAPGGLDKLDVVEMDDPGAPGPGEIRVRLHASSLNYHDYGVASGRMNPADGRIPMSDGAGVVEAVGEGVDDVSVGDSVVSLFLPAVARRSGPDRRLLRHVPATASTAMRAKRWCAPPAGSRLRPRATATPRPPP